MSEGSDDEHHSSKAKAKANANANAKSDAKQLGVLRPHTSKTVKKNIKQKPSCTPIEWDIYKVNKVPDLPEYITPKHFPTPGYKQENPCFNILMPEEIQAMNIASNHYAYPKGLRNAPLYFTHANGTAYSRTLICNGREYSCFVFSFLSFQHDLLPSYHIVTPQSCPPVLGSMA